MASWIGSTLHVSQGREVASWTAGDGIAVCQLRIGRKAEGKVLLTLPGRPTKAQINGQPLTGTQRRPGIWEFLVSFDQQADLQVWYE